MRFKSRKGDQGHGKRTRADMDRGLGFDVVFRVYGGAVALTLELMSCFRALPTTPPFSYIVVASP